MGALTKDDGAERSVATEAVSRGLGRSLNEKDIAEAELDAKVTELAAIKKRGLPLLFIVLALAILTMVSAIAGTSIGLPPGLHMITGPVMVVFSLIRMPAMKRQAQLQKEIAALKGAGASVPPPI